MVDEPNDPSEPNDPFPPDDEEPPQAASAVDRESQKRIRNKAKRAEAEDRDFWKACLASPVGRRCLWQMLERAQIYNERFASGPNGFPNPEATSYYRGQRDFGLNLLRSWEKLDLAGVMTMRKEHDPVLAEPLKRRKNVKDNI